MKLKTHFSLAALLISLVVFSSCDKKSGYDKIDLIPVKTSDNGNWSMINSDGEIVYEDEFKHHPTLSYNGYFSVEESDGYSLYKSGGKKPEIVKGLEGLYSIGYVEDGLIPITKKGERISVADTDGKIQFELKPINGKEVIACNIGFSEGLLPIQLDNDLWGYVDKSGKSVINAKYDNVSSFNGGLALVEKDGIYQVINKKGDTQFKLNKDMDIHFTSFGQINFYEDFCLYVRYNDCIYSIDKKGEKTKLPGKVYSIRGVNDGLIIFTNEEHEYGLMTTDGKELIRPKYESLQFAEDGLLIACKHDSDNSVLINKDGDVKETIDYKDIFYLNKFGYIAEDNKYTYLLDSKFKEKNKESIYRIDGEFSPSYIVESDYIDVASISSSIVSNISSTNVSGLLNTEASKIFAVKDARDYSYSTEYTLESLEKQNGNYTATAKGTFTTAPADYTYDYDSYTSSYYWNSASKLFSINLSYSSSKEWGKRGFEALNKALASAGYTQVATGTSKENNAYTSIYKKGDYYVLTDCPSKSTNWYINVISKQFLDTLGTDANSYLSSLINVNGTIDDAAMEEVAPEVAVVEEAAAEW